MKEMSIETYTTAVFPLYLFAFLLLIPVGIWMLWRKLRKKPVRYWWAVPYSMVCLVFAIFSTAIAAIAYDDPADPNYRIYEGWELKDFVLQDIKTLAVCALLGAVLCFVFGRKGSGPIKKFCGALLVAFAIVVVLLVLLSFVSFAAG